MASPSTVITLGLGSFGTAAVVLTLGYGIGVVEPVGAKAAVVLTPLKRPAIWTPNARTSTLTPADRAEVFTPADRTDIATPLKRPTVWTGDDR